MENKKPSLLRSLGLGLIVILVIVVFAYGVQVTDVNFETTRSEIRLTQLKRVIRALAHPDIIEYEIIETLIEIPFYLPCPEGQAIEAPDQDTNQTYLLASKYCGSPKDIILIEGFNFVPGSKGPLDFFTASGIKKPLEDFVADNNGYFSIEVELPTRQPVAEAQHIRATIRDRVGSPLVTRTATATLDKIIETVFMALLATAIGTAVAIPISFIAARNLMAENKSPLTSMAFSLIGWPVGIYLGLTATNLLKTILHTTLDNSLNSLIGVLISLVIVFVLLRWSVKPGETKEISQPVKILRGLAMLVSGVFGVAALLFLEVLSRATGSALVEILGVFGFLGNFLFQVGEAARLIIPAITALAIGAVVGGSLGKLGQTISDKSSEGIVKIINLVSASLAGGTLFALIGTALNWFYQIDNLSKTLYWPAGIGGAIGLILAIIVRPKQALPTGLAIYFITRTILNGTRSIESLIMAIVFVIWVGIGPFAGSLALALHTMAALAKLYSEQVESILPGPLEAIQATGANRLQTIVYAVVPQIVSPYTSFTMYRWDINVRMSTIIGFVGGGGIGFLLQQNIQLLHYRAASVQMLAIAVVVALMDYISSIVREKMV